jgi:predicted  nucleic acid-binding Zn-ribbon protein
VDDQESNTSGSGLPISAAIAGFVGFTVVGLVLGIVGHSLFGETNIVKAPPEVIKQELSEQELLALCDSTTEDVRDSLNNAQQKVVDLQAQLDSKEKELTDMKAQDEKDEVKKAAAVKKWHAMEQEIADLQVRLAQAESERDQLRTELQDTLVKLDHEIAEKEKAVKLAKKYKRESVENLWTAFTANAKVEICDKGTRKRHENCHEAVDSAVATQQVRFTECVEKYDTIPVLKQGDAKSEIPAFADWVNPESKYVNTGVFNKQSWYVIYCDPTLPEAHVDADEIPL